MIVYEHVFRIVIAIRFYLLTMFVIIAKICLALQLIESGVVVSVNNNNNEHKKMVNVNEKVKHNPFTYLLTSIDLFDDCLERIRRCAVQTNESNGHTNEFHLDVPSMPTWHNNSIAPVHVQSMPTHSNAGHHPSGIDRLGNNIVEQMERMYLTLIRFRSMISMFVDGCRICLST
jgi:hypothetical protein